MKKEQGNINLGFKHHPGQFDLKTDFLFHDPKAAYSA